MKLPVPFLQLPIQFDAARLREEMRALGSAAWRAHPSNYPGNYSMPLIAVDGDPDNDEVAGPMLPTAYLERCPYLLQVLGRLGAVWGRTRLMKLAGGAEVTPHVDTNYYWREHMRVHVPIQTTASVRFLCGDAEVNMQEGECWIFDTWRPHHVINANAEERVHLVADTIGGDGFWQLAEQARTPDKRHAPPWHIEQFTADSDVAGEPFFERVNVPLVMTPWELREHMQFLLAQTRAHPLLQGVQQAGARFISSWHALWARFGDGQDGWQPFAALRDGFDAWLGQNAEGLMLANGTPLARTMRAMILSATMTAAAGGRSTATVAEGGRIRDAAVARQHDSGDPFVRPVFIVCPPRSGSSLLFETLSASPDAFTLGDESHRLIEVEIDHGSLGAIARGYPSNRLIASDATTNIATELRASYRERVLDRDGNRPRGPVRLLEKTPKNALRVPFLSTVFPDALFVYLYRDPREVMASMLEAWESGRFRTYPDLPDWQGLPWSLVLVPGWRDLIGRPLAEVVAAQWAVTTRTLLDDLESLPPGRVRAVNYTELLADPDAEVRKLCQQVGFAWDRELVPPLPLARYTVTPPDQTKWRKREHEVAPLMTNLAPLQARAEQLARRWSQS